MYQLSGRLALAVAGLLLVSLGGCGTQTSVSGEWQQERPAAAPFSNVLVVGVSPDSRARRSFELALTEAIGSGRTRASASVQSAESATRMSPEIVSRIASSTGSDAVAVTRLANRKVTATQSASRTGVKTQRPGNIKDDPADLFRLEYHEYEEPGVMSAQSTAIVETSVYETAGEGRLLYVLTTTAEYEEDRDDVIGDVAKAIAAKLRRDGLIR